MGLDAEGGGVHDDTCRELENPADDRAHGTVRPFSTSEIELGRSFAAACGGCKMGRGFARPEGSRDDDPICGERSFTPGNRSALHLV